MIGAGIFKRIFGTSHERMMRKLHPIVVKINDLEDQIKALSDEELKAQTPKFKEMLDNGATLDDILPEAFATVRETGRRVLNMRHYDVQMIGGIVLHRGMISEMKTGEGKTLVATSPMYLNALAGKGAHLVTVNDYLASRDADWMGQIYKFLGLSVGKILADLDNETRRQSYNCDITYGTNNEFGFDYLRDNMKYQLSDYVQRGHYYAIVDEVDSILIDEARTPLIISGQLEQDLNLYKEINKLVPFLKRDEDYAVDEKAQSVALNESGIEKLEKHLKIDNIYDPKYIEYLHHVNKALQAHTLYKLDQNYVIENGKVVIIDDFTGRMMYGRRWSDGLHQAIEAKEGVEIQAESQTLATITFQNYFRMYDKLAGMTGTADTEAEEFKKIYKLDVVSIPTANPVIRKDYQDVVYFNEKAKIAAIAAQIQECHEKGQPILVGTVSVEKSEVFSKAISKLGIPHNVLNAKNHKREAEIIAQAGRKGAVTIATNMAGRGTDILLGGNPEFLARQEVAETDPAYPAVLEKYKAQCAAEKAEVREAGGLFILGTERHESRRIDNQLRGRAGRQGDPGASRFFLSLDDDLLRIFGGEELKNRMAMFGMDKQADIPIESRIVTKSIETAQKRVEGRNFDIRKNLLEYDDVMNAQRKSIYGLRSKILKGEDLENEVLNAFEDIIYSYADQFMPPTVDFEDWDFAGLQKTLGGVLGIKLNLNASNVGRGDRDAHIKLIWDDVELHYKTQVDKFERVRTEILRHVGHNEYYEHTTGTAMLMELAQNYYLREIDHFWRAHLTTMTSLRESISFRGYAQKDPKQEYKREAFSLFEKMMINIKTRMMTQLCAVEPQMPDFNRMQSNARANARAVQSIQEAREAGMSRAPVSSNASMPERDEAQVEELQSMAVRKRQPQPSLSMAELMAVAQNQKPKAPDTMKKPLSMADLMPVSIAKAAGVQRAEAEAPKRPLSMADLMPVSITNAMKAAAEEQRRYMEKLRQEALEESEADEAEDVADEELDEAISAEDEDESGEGVSEYVFDEPVVIQTGESEKSNDTKVLDNKGETVSSSGSESENISSISAEAEKISEPETRSNDSDVALNTALSESDLQSLGSMLDTDLSLSSGSDLERSDSKELSGWGDEGLSDSDKHDDDNDPFGLFKSLGI